MVRKIYIHQMWIAIEFFLWCVATINPLQAQQVTSDGTLPTEVISSDNRNFTINGGSREGGNLFHSFDEFSLPEGGTAFFNNAPDVENIINRVTGGSISKIDGLIESRGGANLFLINPQGIVFGRNSSLKIGGSFVASTASRLNFKDGSFFSATDLQASPLLTMSVPSGLQFGKTGGIIRNQSQATRSVEGEAIRYGLEVQPGKTIALVGGDIFLEGGRLYAPEGRIELGSVAALNLVNLTSIPAGWSLGYEGVQNFQDVQLSQNAFAQTAGSDSSGDIQVYGRRLVLTEKSGLVASSDDQVGPGGTLKIKTSESVEISNSELTTGAYSAGLAADITIGTKRLIVKDGSFVDASSGEEGTAGNLTINASEFVEVDNSQLSTRSFGNGKAGDVRITTGNLIVRNGAQILVNSEETGDAGNLYVQARTISLNNEGQLTATSEAGKGGGNITLQGLESLILRGKSEISTNAGGEGNGGDITIGTKLLTALGNSSITANAIGEGNGGNVRIKTQGLFLSPNSEISATSQRGVDGVVEIDRLENDPEGALLTLPAEPVNISGLIAQGCSSGSVARNSKFVVTGRGGLPPTPKEAFRGDVALADLGKPIETEATQAKVIAPTNQKLPESTPLVEAQGWVIGSKGEVILTASAPNVTPSVPWMKSNSCHG